MLFSGQKTKAGDNNEHAPLESTSVKAEEKSSLESELSDQKSQGQLDQPSCNTKENSNASPELTKIALNMSHSLEHPGSPDHPVVLPCPGSQSLPAGTIDNNQTTAVSGSAAVSMAGAPGAPGSPGTGESHMRENSANGVPVVGLGSPSGTQELPAGLPAPAVPAVAASAATGQPPNPTNSEGPENCGTLAGHTSSHGNQDADAAPDGQLPNFINTEPSADNGVAAGHISRNQETPAAVSAANASASPGEPAADSGIATHHTSSRGTEEMPAAVSSTTASVLSGDAQNPESTASKNDEVNASLQPNAATGAVPQNEGQNSSQRPTGVPVQVSENDGDTSTAGQMDQQEETDNSTNYEHLLGKQFNFLDYILLL